MEVEGIGYATLCVITEAYEQEPGDWLWSGSSRGSFIRGIRGRWVWRVRAQRGIHAKYVGLHLLPRRRSNGATTRSRTGDSAVRGKTTPIQRGERDSPPPPPRTDASPPLDAINPGRRQGQRQSHPAADGGVHAPGPRRFDNTSTTRLSTLSTVSLAASCTAPSRDGDPAHRLAAISRRPLESSGATVAGRWEADPAANSGTVFGGSLQSCLRKPAANYYYFTGHYQLSWHHEDNSKYQPSTLTSEELRRKEHGGLQSPADPYD